MERPASLALLLLEELDKNDIRYCLWKSDGIASALAGLSDIDLLIDKATANQSDMILLSLDFKRVITQPRYRVPGIEDWIGCDAETGNLIHIHLHYQILTGLRFVKEQRIPWEELILETAVKHPALNIYMINPDLETILLTLRAGLEVGCMNLFLSCLNKKFLPRKILSRQLDLRATADREQVNKYLRRLFPTKYVRQLEIITLDKEIKTRSLIKIRRIAYKTLRTWRRYDRIASFAVQAFFTVSILIQKALKKLFKISYFQKKRLRTEGSIIAVIGCDGAGKTTVTKMLYKWLIWKIDAEKLYLGSGSGLNRGIYSTKKFFMNHHQIRKSVIAQKPKSKSKPGQEAEKSIIRMTWRAFMAHRMYKLILRAKRECTKGKIILTDRYPQNSFNGIYDGPGLKGKEAKTILHKALIKYESKKYEQLESMPPNIVVKLLIPAEIAIKRTGDPQEDLVRKKAEITKVLSFPGAKIIEIDAAQPINEVILDVKQKVWVTI